MKKGILVGITTKNDEYDIEYSMEELTNLCKTCDIEASYTLTQKLLAPTAGYYIGKGKLEEIKMAIATYDAEIVVFNDELSPAQIRNINEIIPVEIIDRSLLILEIFAKRASTNEAKLEIELARKNYLLPRISFMREKESRSGGASGSMSSKGAGETQRELDRRTIMMDIIHIKKELDQLMVMKQNQIEKRKRNAIPIVALTGYTNAGKSSTMNTIINFCNKETKKEVYEKDELFATLTTFNRLITYKKQNFILVDTVGFVSKLPHHLVQSFHQTLEEIKHADLIIHVVDSSSPYFETQMQVTNQVIQTLNPEHSKMLYLLNKADLTENRYVLSNEKSLTYSNKTKEGLEELLDTIVEAIKPITYELKVLIPYSQGSIINLIEEKAEIKAKIYQNDGVFFDIIIDSKYYQKLTVFEVDSFVS